MLVLLIYQSIKLAVSNNSDETVSDGWSDFIKALYFVGLCGPMLNWVFIFFLISRLNERVRFDSNPAFLDSLN